MEFNDWHLAEIIATILEVAGVLVIGIGALAATIVSLRIKLTDRKAVTYVAFRREMSRWLLLGLELLIAADVITTVTLNLELEAILSLGILVLIRTFLAWSITMETEGHWPWQRTNDARADETD